MEKVSTGQTLAAMLLIAGTSIGGGMLALPVATGLSGFLPSIALMLFVWVMMTATGLLLVEATLWFPEGAHFSTISEEVLGKVGKYITWVFYLFIGYGSIVGYTAAGGEEFSRIASNWSGLVAPHWVGCLMFLLAFGLMVCCGSYLVGRVNAVLFIGMVFAYFGVLFLGVHEVQASLLLRQNWKFSLFGIPLMLTCFSYQALVPSLVPLLKKNVNALYWAIIGGTTLTLLMYIVWQGVVLGVLPAYGEASLMEAFEKGVPATFYLRDQVSSSVLSYFIEFFSFFAIVTSFLGIALGLYDFLADGLKIQRKGKGKILLGTLLLLPTWAAAIYFERIFLLALDLTGGLGDSVLNGILPVALIWMGRYRQGRGTLRLISWGRWFLVLVLIFFSISLLVECLVHLGFVSAVYDVSDVNIL